MIIGAGVAFGKYLVEKADTGSGSGKALQNLVVNLGFVALGGTAGLKWGFAARDMGLVKPNYGLKSLMWSRNISREWNQIAPGLDRWRHAVQVPVNFGKTGPLWAVSALIGQMTCSNPLWRLGC
jgi:hypothetical protein